MEMLLFLQIIGHKSIRQLAFWPADGARWIIRGTQVLQFILRGTWMSEPNFIAIPLIVIFHWTGFNLVAVQVIVKITRIHPLGIMCTKFCAITYCSIWKLNILYRYPPIKQHIKLAELRKYFAFTEVHCLFQCCQLPLVRSWQNYDELNPTPRVRDQRSPTY